MKTIEQVAWKIAGEIGESYSLEDNEVILNPAQFATKFLEAWLAQQEPVAWLVGSVIDSFAVKGYETCSEADAKLCDGFPVFLAPQQPVHSEPFAWLAPNGMTLSTYPVLNSQALYLASPTSPEGFENAINEAIIAEREACARVADDWQLDDACETYLCSCATAIRERVEKK